MVGLIEAGAPWEMSRDDFALEYWQYRPGQHVSFFGPTGVGKTTLALMLATIARQDHPRLRVANLVMKPDKGPSYKKGSTGDETVSKLTRSLGGRIVRTWPPQKWPWEDEPSFWSLWPKHSDDPIADRGLDEKGRIAGGHSKVFRDTILDCYRTGSRIIFADEVVSLDHELKLRDYMETVWSKGRSVECGMWGATQRPAWVSRHMYSQASHLFMWSENDEEARKRYGEIGRGDRAKVLNVLGKLKKHQCLYMNPDHPDGPKWAVLT